MKPYDCVDLVIGTIRCEDWIHMQALNCAKRGVEEVQRSLLDAPE